jgi:hypothetical protein
MNIYYVYAYLRESDNTPYYIGKGKSYRAYDKNHSVSVPNDRSKIVFIAEELTNEDACTLERETIRKYGRKDIGTGILHNRTDGGEGALGYKQSLEHIEKKRISNQKPRPSMQGRKWSPEHCTAISSGLKGHKKVNTDNMCGPKTELHSKNISLGKRGKKLAVVTCPHCNKTGGRGNMMRYHFDFCKSITDASQG